VLAERNELAQVVHVEVGAGLMGDDVAGDVLRPGIEATAARIARARFTPCSIIR
jgi:hypothetical protein